MTSTAHPLPRALLRLEGEQARPFLDALLTQSLDGLDAAPRYAALLSPQGKVIADMFVWSLAAGGALLDLDPTRAEAVVERLRMYLLRRPVGIADVSGEHGVWVSPGQPDLAGAARDPRRPDGALGWRAIGPAHAATAAPAPYTALLLKAGVPDLAHDAAPEEVFALEALLEELQGVDFHKGCFIGQENVSRMKRRATTRRKFCPLLAEGEALAVGAAVTAGGVELGTVRASLSGRALALLRLDRAQEALAAGQGLTVEGRTVTLDPPPWLLLPPVGQEAG